MRSFNSDGSTTTCECGKVSGHWVDAAAGTAVLVVAPEHRALAHILSLHNGFLNDGPTLIPETYFDHLTQQQVPYPHAQQDTFWRELHAQAAITPRAPETVRVWDQSSRACWAVVLTPGTTADTSWE